MLVGLSSFAQNTKGDKPQSSRETRFKKTEKKKNKRTIGERRNRGKTSDLRAYKPRKKASGGERAGRAIRTASGRVTGARSSTGKNKNVYPQTGRFVNNPSKDPQSRSRFRGRTASGNKVITRSPSSGGRNIYPQRGRYVHNPARTPRDDSRGISNRSVLNRVAGLQSPDRPPRKRAKVRPRSASRAFIARKTINVQARFPRPRRKQEQAYTRDIAGRRLRTRNYQTPPQKIIRPDHSRKLSRSGDPKLSRSHSDRFGRFRNHSSAKPQGQGVRGIRIIPRSISGAPKRVYPQYGRFSNNPSRRPRSVEHPVSNRRTLQRLQGLQTTPQRNKTVTVVPRSASRAFMARKSTNTWAHFPRPKRKGERAFLRDLAGKPLRTRNYRSPHPGLLNPTFRKYMQPRRFGDKPYQGPAAGGFSTATKRGERGWRGDIARRSIRGIKTPKQDTPTRIMPQGYKSASRPGETRTGTKPLQARQPGLGGLGMMEYARRFKGRKPLKGGGSVSGKVWNNNNRALITRTPPKSALEMDGIPKRMRSERRGFSDQGEEYTGNIKAKRPAKGGGSISGKLWNNNEQPLQARTPAAGYDRIGKFQGNLKAKRPEKGGGSISGKLWNNNEQPLQVRNPAAGYDRIGRFQGNLKAKRPEKGGGSISGKLWNNNEEPITVRTPKSSAAEKAGLYTGNVRLSRFRRPYIKNPNASALALKKERPSKSVFQEGELQVRVKQYNYIRNPSSAKEASKVREPGKAFARAADYQGNIRMAKFRLFDKNRELHPDARFVKTNKNNVKTEKSTTTNLKLWWARLFKKNETQPDHLKDKERKPRYDKGEAGLWYD
jgi:hypothetical protein